MLAAICDRRGIAVGGEVASHGSASSPALARRAGRRVRAAARDQGAVAAAGAADVDDGPVRLAYHAMPGFGDAVTVEVQPDKWRGPRAAAPPRAWRWLRARRSGRPGRPVQPTPHRTPTPPHQRLTQDPAPILVSPVCAGHDATRPWSGGPGHCAVRPCLPRRPVRRGQAAGQPVDVGRTGAGHRADCPAASCGDVRPPTHILVGLLSLRWRRPLLRLIRRQSSPRSTSGASNHALSASGPR
jgi:hypothetical protein